MPLHDRSRYDVEITIVLTRAPTPSSPVTCPSRASVEDLHVGSRWPSPTSPTPPSSTRTHITFAASQQSPNSPRWDVPKQNLTAAVAAMRALADDGEGGLRVS